MKTLLISGFLCFINISSFFHARAILNIATRQKTFFDLLSDEFCKEYDAKTQQTASIGVCMKLHSEWH